MPVMTDNEIRRVAEEAGRSGAKQMLEEMGLTSPDALRDIRDLRSLLVGLRMVRRTVLRTIVATMTVALLAAVFAGIALKIKLVG